MNVPSSRGRISATLSNILFFAYILEWVSNSGTFLLLVYRYIYYYKIRIIEHLHRIDQIPKLIAVENINTRHLVKNFFINIRIFHVFSHRIDQILE